NKMDLVDYSQEVFDKIKNDYIDFAAKMAADDVHFIPLSALKGDNVLNRSSQMPWYDGNTLMHMLENVYIASDRNLRDFRFPVQYVNRPHLDFRGFCGTVASGTVRQGDEVLVLPSRKTSRVASIVTHDGDLEEAFAPQSVTLTLEDEIDISRGDMIVRPGNVPRVDNQMEAIVVWMSEEPMVPGKQYLFKQTTKLVSGSIAALRYQVDVNTLHRQDAPRLSLNEIGRCAVTLSEAIAFDAYKLNRATGAMVIVDRITNRTVGAAMIMEPMRGDARDHWDDAPVVAGGQSTGSQVTLDERTARYGQKATTILLTGLTGSGKRLVAQGLERVLFDAGHACTILDGKQMRLGISRDLGFSADERSENLRRAAEVAKLMNDAGMITIASFVAPSSEVRRRAREVVGAERFVEIYLDVPVEICRERDDSEMYDKADSGEIKYFPGVTGNYDVPESPDLVLKPHQSSVDDCVEQIVSLLKSEKVIP
ncbi:MAG TPA: adenylyl-sulfate kinase, partial [Pirellulales bacterium]|nr:adenylyl-sulfate kinase [Pirellulales bacterium]